MQICSKFNRLQCLYFNSTSDRKPILFDHRQPIDSPSNLLELHVALHSFDDCLFLLAGHFNQLRTYDITICFDADRSASPPDNEVNCSLIFFFNE